MKLSNIIGAICCIAVLLPWLLVSLQRGDINVNGLLLNFAETIGEIITREDLNWRTQYDAPQPRQSPSQRQNQEGL